MMQDYPDFEITIRGHQLLSVLDGILKIDGKDYSRDLSDLTAVISTLSDVVRFAGIQHAGKSS